MDKYIEELEEQLMCELIAHWHEEDRKKEQLYLEISDISCIFTS